MRSSHAVRRVTEEKGVRKRYRGKGHPVDFVGFQCPRELREAADQEGDSRTEGMIVLLDRAVQSKDELGDLWTEVLVRAAREQITEGEALGRFAREAIEAQKKQR